ncbi:MAG TPA: ferritin family protein [Candidatus Acidoferrales bacterium]|jgi:rubrerythrin
MAKKRFKDLSEKEILALAIQLEEEDGRVYSDFADGLRDTYPSTAKMFEDMQAEESRHRQRLIDLYQQRFGNHIPLIRRQDVKGFVERRPEWLVRPLGINKVRKQAEIMELETERFYERALQQVSDASTRKLLGDLAEIERQHYAAAESIEEKQAASGARTEEDTSRKRLFMLQVVQPGLAGLMDGSVSTLAPIFAAALATHKTWDAFLVGLAASLGAGISMAFAEALSDDGSLTGRGKPLLRGIVTGSMTTLGGLGHTLPFLIPDFHIAFTAAVAVVIVELGIISFVRHRYMDMPIVSSAVQVIVGGGLVFAVGILIGSS